MKHVANIEKLLKTLVPSATFHALVIASPPGWAKSTTIDAALEHLGLEHHAVGAYTSPLALYHALCDHPDKVIVLDDCAGLFSDARAMAILKAATWPSAGTAGARRIAWSSTSDKVQQGEAVFDGKIVLLTNVIPVSKEVQAFFSRTLLYRIRFTAEDVKELLLAASKSVRHFADLVASSEVAEFLTTRIVDECGADELSLRTLQMGCELRAANPEDWRDLLSTLLTTRGYAGEPAEVVRELAAEKSSSVSEQVNSFRRATGLSRRTFFHYRRKLDLSRNYERAAPEPNSVKATSDVDSSSSGVPM